MAWICHFSKIPEIFSFGGVDIAALDMDEMECSDKLGLGKKFGLPKHDLTLFKVAGENASILGFVFGYFGALLGACGVCGCQ